MANRTVENRRIAHSAHLSRRKLLRLAVCGATLYFLAASALQAATFTVTNDNDSGVGSLRQAVIDANASGGVDTIAIDPAINGSTISLLSPLPALTNHIIFSGPTTSTLTISSGSPIFTGAFSITKDDAGTLIISGTNSYSGGTTVEAGVLEGNTSGVQGNIFNNSNVVFDQSVAGTYSGNMSGSGALAKEGAGTLILSGNNSHSGGTTVTSGALRGNVSSLPGDIENNAEVIFDQASNGAYTGNLSGSGSVTKQGAAELAMTGINTYTGGTTVSAGVLRGYTTSLPGDIENNAAVIFEQITAGTYAGDMSGIGSLTKQGNGTLTLSGTNTYSGGTTVSAGAIRGSTASVQGDILNESSVVFEQAINGTYAGEMSGSGAVTKQGAGKLTMTGTNTYTGGTTVTAGTLAGNTLSLQGNILNNSSVDFEQAIAGTYAGNMTGNGSLTKRGNGTLILSGTNSYSGGTTVAEGSLQGNFLGIQGNITNNATVVFEQAAAGIYWGNMTGTGALVKQGAGTLTMTGINTYAGGTTVTAGVLRGNTTNLPGDIENNAAVIFDQATNGTYSGDMSGIGSLTKEGSGTLTLSGTNTYSGGTTVTAGAIRGSTASVQGDILNNSSVVFDQAIDGTYAGDMSGSGMMTKQGAGKLTMTGANTYSGGTTVTAGTLAGNTLSLQGDILNNSFVDFEQAVAGTYADDMSGTGSLIKRGNGSLTLTGINSYSGGTSVIEGSLQGSTVSVQGDITNNATVNFDQMIDGTYAGDMTGTGTLVKHGVGALALTGINSYSGGTTVSLGTLEGDSESLQGNITNNSEVIFDQAFHGTYSGNMSGTGDLTKDGAGNLIVTGTNTYVGSTTVIDGRLTVNGSLTGQTTVQSGGELWGSGQVGSVINHGVVAPGNSIGTLTVNGDYTQANNGTLQLEITPAGQSDRINATGSATVDGDLVVTGGGSFSAGTTYTFLTAPNGISGTFANTQFDFGNGLYTDSQIIGYGSNELQLLVVRNATMFASFADSPNQEAVAATLDALNPLATGDFAEMIDQLNLLGVPELTAALDQLTGEIYADLPAVEFENTTRYLSLVTERIRNNSCYSTACCSVDDDDDRFGKAPPWNTWVLGYGMGADVSGDDNASGIDYTLMGTAVGVDSDLDEFTSLGVSYGFTPFLIDRNSDRIDAETHQISVYANRLFGPQYLLGVVSFGRNDFEATRQIAYDDVLETAESEFSSGQFAFYVEAGGNRNLGDYFVQPLVGLQYVNVSQDAFDETGAGSLDLTLPKTTTDSLRSALGGRLARPYFTEWGGMIAPEIRARWMHEFLNDPQNISPSFADAPDEAFTIQGITLGRDFLVFGAGITAELTPSISGFVNYDAQVSANEQAHGGNGGLKWVW